MAQDRLHTGGCLHQTRLSPELETRIGTAKTPAAQYVARYYQRDPGTDFMWDELAAGAWLDPTLITKKETRYISVDVDHGAGYGNTLTAKDKASSKLVAQPVEIQLDLNAAKFYDMFANLVMAPTPPIH